MKIKLKQIPSRGGTIVEVLISIAVIGSVLVGAFQVSQSSAAGVRNSQESSEMLQLLQSQIELVRNLALAQPDGTSGIYGTSPRYFCIGNDGLRKDSPGLGAGQLMLADSDNFSLYNSACRNLQGRYNIAVSYDNSTKTFTAVGRWDAIGGEKFQEQLQYRIQPGIAPVAVAPVPAGGGGAGAVVGGAPCYIDPATGVCYVNAVPGYVWRYYVLNRSDNPGVPVLGCEWRWSDGVVQQDVACDFGDRIDHLFPARPVRPFNQDCRAYLENVTFTLRLANGLTATTTYTFRLPQCY